jgi:hypothetical protein
MKLGKKKNDRSSRFNPNKQSKGKRGTVCCGMVFDSGDKLAQHFREYHPRISKQGFVGNIESIQDEKLKKFILRKRGR